jgi:hypothetical protein
LDLESGFLSDPNDPDLDPGLLSEDSEFDLELVFLSDNDPDLVSCTWFSPEIPGAYGT